MFSSIGKAVFGSRNDRIIKQYSKQINAINALEAEYEKLPDRQLKAKTEEFRSRLKNKETTDDLLVEAFATVREGAKRSIGLRHYDVQLMGGIALHEGNIAEMKTGEGKTLVATLAVYLNALPAEGVHVVTVNDYLAKRDSAWMKQVYNFLGLSVGCITNDVDGEERKAQYDADITYGTNNEFGFDYLRDNLKMTLDSIMQRKHSFAIVDEVDSILIDEARTPLIISGPSDDKTEHYVNVNKIIPQLDKKHFDLDEKSRSITLSEDGMTEAEKLLKSFNMLPRGTGLYDMDNIGMLHALNQGLKAHYTFKKDVDYIVREGKIFIIDEFTGRVKEGSRYSDGLHQAIEAKENVAVLNENQTLASITYQNYFRLYNKLAGMTGTAITEAAEFEDIYNLEVVEIPTNVEVSRVDDDDRIYRTLEEKNQAIIETIKECNQRKQPVLVGTVSVESSEGLSKALTAQGIKHNVLNAKQHSKEASVISLAGKPSAVTIATNMAGRGTDIKLGGNPEFETAAILANKDNKSSPEAVKSKIENQYKIDKQIVLDAGGLFVLGTERHESRRIDNQLRGRSGRQGDPGQSRFYLSIQDDLMRIFGTGKLDSMLQKLGMKEGEAIIHPWVSKALETAQKKVEGRNYDMRKNILKFDDVVNDQRKEIYEQRLAIMERDDLSEEIKEMRLDVVDNIVNNAFPEGTYIEDWDLNAFQGEVMQTFAVMVPIKDWIQSGIDTPEGIKQKLHEVAAELMEIKENDIGAETMRSLEKQILLLTLDHIWKDHLHALDGLRQGIGLRAYGQKDPLREYKQEAFTMFDQMLDGLKTTLTQRLAYLEVKVEHNLDLLSEMDAAKHNERKEGKNPNINAQGDEQDKGFKQPAVSTVMKRNFNKSDRDPKNPETWGRIGRNELCPCESGKKYKQCHGKLS